jgi:uncharacterized protein YndB with AHSA1/START domain
MVLMATVGLVLLLAAIAPLNAQEKADMGPQIEVEGVVEAPADQVYEAWTTAEGITSWLAEAANIELTLGGSYEIFFAIEAPEGQRGAEDCKVLSFLPNRMLSMSWNAPPSIPGLRKLGPCTWVVVEFEPESDSQTHLRITHLGLSTGEDWDTYYKYFARAWPNVLKACQDHFAGEK